MHAVDESDSDTDVPRGKVLAAALHLVPGYFACDSVWQTHFVLHPRLKSTGTSAPRSASSPGWQCLLLFSRDGLEDSMYRAETKASGRRGQSQTSSRPRPQFFVLEPSPRSRTVLDPIAVVFVNFVVICCFHWSLVSLKEQLYFVNVCLQYIIELFP